MSLLPPLGRVVAGVIVIGVASRAMAAPGPSAKVGGIAEAGCVAIGGAASGNTINCGPTTAALQRAVEAAVKKQLGTLPVSDRKELD